jgi:hypothetical protein
LFISDRERPIIQKIEDALQRSVFMQPVIFLAAKPFAKSDSSSKEEMKKLT